MSRTEVSIKNSRAVQTPDQYVTVEIHNQNFKNKYRIHRSSVLNELKHTESRLNESLDKKTILHQSSFVKLRRDSTAES